MPSTEPSNLYSILPSCTEQHKAEIKMIIAKEKTKLCSSANYKNMLIMLNFKLLLPRVRTSKTWLSGPKYKIYNGFAFSWCHLWVIVVIMEINWCGRDNSLCTGTHRKHQLHSKNVKYKCTGYGRIFFPDIQNPSGKDIIQGQINLAPPSFQKKNIFKLHV